MAKKKKTKSIWATDEERAEFDRRAMANARYLRELAARGLTPEQRRERGL